MYAEDFFQDPDPFDPAGAVSRLDVDRLGRLRRGPEAEHTDIEVAAALARLVHDEFEEYGTSGDVRLDEEEIRVALRALRSVLDRIGVECRLPFSDFKTFRSHWVANDGWGSWQARRDILNELFEPIHGRLGELEDREIASTLIDPVTPHSGTGWHRVDEEITELRRHFQVARTPQDYRNVGNDCVAVLERLSGQVYEPSMHLREGELEPPISSTKDRLGRFIEDSLHGPDNAEVRKLARAVIELAQRVKHGDQPTRRDAGIAADAVIQLANICRRLDESAGS